MNEELKRIDFLTRKLIVLSQTNREEYAIIEHLIKRSDFDNVIDFLEYKCTCIFRLKDIVI